MPPEPADTPSRPPFLEFYLTDGSLAEPGISFTLVPRNPVDEPVRRFRRLESLSYSA